MTEINNAAGFRSEYRGIVYIDVDEWREHFEEKHFVSFMEYLSDNSDDWLVVLSVSDDKPEQVKQMEAFASAYIRIERITIEPPTVQELTQYAKKLLEGYGVTLISQTEKVLSGSIGELCNNKYFDGYKTVKMLCEDIAYSLYTDGFRKDKGLIPSDLSKFAKDSEYIQRIPIFISCKNGDFDANELYKLNTVAEHFGSKYSKKVLVSTELDKLGEKSNYIRARMDDMGIRSVENVDEMNDSEFERVLKSLWSN